MSVKGKRKIVLVDDHPLVRDSVVMFIEENYSKTLEVVGQAGDGVTAVELVSKLKPDLVLLDVQLPRMDGLTVVRRIKHLFPGIIVLILSMFEDRAHVIEAVHAGADDYIFKNGAGVPLIVSHILQALDGHLPARTPIQQHLMETIRQSDERGLGLGLGKLTGVELEVIRLAAQKGLTMKEIAAELGGREGPLSENTIKKHLEHIYDKLGARNQTHAASLAIKHGLISMDEVEPQLN